MQRSSRAYPGIPGGGLTNMSDVTITSPVNGEVLQYDGTEWVNTGATTLTLQGTLEVDTVNEATAAAGVTIDGLLVKDSGITSVRSIIPETNAAWDLGTAALRFQDLHAENILLNGTAEVDEIREFTVGFGVDVDGVQIKDGGIVCADGATLEVDTVNEATAAAGVTVDGALIKDGGIVCADGASIEVDTINEATAAAGVTVDGVVIKDGGLTLAGHLEADFSEIHDVQFLTVETIGEAASNEGVTVDGTLLKDSGATLTGYLKRPVTTITATSATLTAAHHAVLVDDDTAGGVVTITLPAAASSDQVEYIVKKLGTTANVIVDGNGAETIDGQITQTLTTQYDAIRIVCNGTAWFIL